VSAAINTSLNKLVSAIVKLEKAVDAKQAVPASAPKKAPQTDLFGSMTSGQQNPSNFNAVNVRMLATRLDNAINQVETILKEGRG
jgi:hypothetical protein